jgi:hypothetical protein
MSKDLILRLLVGVLVHVVCPVVVQVLRHLILRWISTSM